MKKVFVAVAVLFAIVGTSQAGLMTGSFTVAGFGDLAFDSSTLDFDQTITYNIAINARNGDFVSIFPGSYFQDTALVPDVSGNPHGSIDDWAVVKDSSDNTVLKIDLGSGSWTLGAGTFLWQDVPVVFQDPTGNFDDTPGLMTMGGQTGGGWSGSFLAVPEPMTLALLGLGGLMLRRKK